MIVVGSCFCTVVAGRGKRAREAVSEMREA